MARSKPYFRTIKTQGPNEDYVTRDHNQKLNNYQKYNWAAVDSELKDRVPITFDIEIKHMNLSSCMKNHDFVLVTVLCCEDEYGEEGDEKK